MVVMAGKDPLLVPWPPLAMASTAAGEAAAVVTLGMLSRADPACLVAQGVEEAVAARTYPT